MLCAKSSSPSFISTHSIVFKHNFNYHLSISGIHTASDIPRCRKGDSKCIVKSANEILKIYAEGIFPNEPMDKFNLN